MKCITGKPKGENKKKEKNKKKPKLDIMTIQ